MRNTKSGPPKGVISGTAERLAATQGFGSLTQGSPHLSQNPAQGFGGTCNGDSGGPNFLESSGVLAAVTSSGDSFCRSTNVAFRLDTALARDFLDDYVRLP